MTARSPAIICRSWWYFGNPYDRPFSLTSYALSNGTVSLAWAAAPNRLYSIEASPDLANWTVIVSNLASAGSPTLSFSTNLAEPVNFFRIYRVP